MRIQFVYKTDEWGKICESINLYLQYCHKIDKSNIKFCKYDPTKENPCCDGINPNDGAIMAVPLFEKVSDEITPHGLEIIKSLRKKIGYGFKTLFLVLSKQDIPDHFHPENDMHYYAESLLGNPEFGNVDKAVFLGELIYKEKEAPNEKTSSEDKKYTNIINLQERDALRHLADLLNGEKKLLSIDQKLREKYYDIFVKYYDEIKDGGEIAEGMKKLLTEVQEIYKKLNGMEQFPLLKLINSKKEVELIKLLLNKAQKIYRIFNGMEQSGHSDPLELFKAPVPFPLIELIQVKEEIEENLKRKKDPEKEKAPITLLLIDNKKDKIANKDLQNTINLMEKIDDDRTNPLFEVKMLENFTYPYKKGSSPEPGDDDTFKSSEFRKAMREIFDDKKEDSEENYAIRVYEKIKDCDFVLLDFFLNTENTYLAFGFIKDIAKIKKKEGDYSTTWYFITSSVYDSVVKYSQSGLLAEYYESAVVSAGDDPTNKKRQIIFLYKLLTFIKARITNFKNLQKDIYDKLFAKDGKCKYWDEDEKKCTNGGIDCLEKELLVIIRRYLHEFDDVKEFFFPNEDESDDRKNIVESLENLIKQFIWLPEADWPMIQRQLDFINTKAERISAFTEVKRQFSCNYIREEIKKRSDIY